MTKGIHVRIGWLVLGILGVAQMNALAQEPRPRFSRRDLPELKTRDRAGVFAALRSFDDHGLSEGEFTVKTLELIDPERVPGLPEASGAGDTARAIDALFKACRGDRVAPPRTPVSASILATADDVLEHRFSFYGEEHQLPKDINWDANPGTDHWGHDLNRYTFLTPLVRAYVATGDARYSRKAVELILDWISKCNADITTQQARNGQQRGQPSAKRPNLSSK